MIIQNTERWLSIEDLPDERWLPLDGFPAYQVSNKGRVRRMYIDSRRNREKKRVGMPRNILKQNLTGCGYLHVSIGNCTENHKSKDVHRLVARCFIPNPDNLPQINHKDEDKKNNDISNLEWCTASYNIRYGTHIQRRTEHCNFKGENNPMYGRRGESNPNSRKIYCYDLRGTFLREFSNSVEASKELKVNINSLRGNAHRRTSRCGNYIFRYEFYEYLTKENINNYTRRGVNN